jgi:hypothetical protein
MIAAGLSQLHNVDDEFGVLSATVEHVYLRCGRRGETRERRELPGMRVARGGSAGALALRALRRRDRDRHGRSSPNRQREPCHLCQGVSLCHPIRAPRVPRFVFADLLRSPADRASS